MKKSNFYKYLILFIFLKTSTLFGLELLVNPYLGSGEVSDGSRVQSVTGIRAALKRNHEFGAYRIGPLFQAGNSYLNTKGSRNGRRTYATFDNRYFLLGAHIGHLKQFTEYSREIYASLSAGGARTKYTEDESGENYYSHRHYSDIKGQYYSAEIGSNFRVKRNISLNVGALYAHYVADTKQADGSVNGEIATKKGVFSLTDEEAGERKLDQTITQKFYLFSLGINFIL